jgi:hypothetical protein
VSLQPQVSLPPNTLGERPCEDQLTHRMSQNLAVK